MTLWYLCIIYLWPVFPENGSSMNIVIMSVSLTAVNLALNSVPGTEYVLDKHCRMNE